MKIKDIDIKQLFELMKEHDIAEISLKEGKTIVEVKRNKEPAFVNAGPDISFVNQTSANAPETGLTKTGAKTKETLVEQKQPEPSTAPESIVENYHAVTAPLVGTFYRAPTPDEDPFVEVGDQVNSGDVLCVVEAMKSMNEIQSDVSGVVKEICADNSDLVEFDQVLFKIEKNG